ncbi:hypothetical protein F5Y03DRAFT_97182 [Xylaria venustula]|nr:hypothetical protein F5Y03DRAFT_97182 [Xylaria venustula]
MLSTETCNRNTVTNAEDPEIIPAMMDRIKINHPALDEAHKSLGSQDAGQDNAKQVHRSQDHKHLESVAPSVGYLPHQPPTSSSDLESRLKESEQSLENEKRYREREGILNEKAIDDLQSQLKNAEAQLEMERAKHQQTRLDLIEKDKYANRQRQLMLDAVSELNRYLRGNQVSNQATDDEIIQKVMMLRIAIRDFAILHFEGDIDHFTINQGSLESLNELLRLPLDDVVKYISTSTTRVNIVRAFLWAYLFENVFNRYSWTWQGASNAFHDISGFLGCFINDNGGRDAQGQRKFHTWRANTASLLVEAMSFDETTVYSDRKQLIQRWSHHICQLLEPFRLSRRQDYMQGLEGILSSSLELDKEICKQIANFEWIIPKKVPCAFVPGAMEVEPGQQHHNGNGLVTLVLGPGLVKHGKSSGDRFDMTERLLKIQVFCDRPLGDMAEDKIVSEPQERKGKAPGIKGKFQEYRRRLGNASVPEHSENLS